MTAKLARKQRPERHYYYQGQVERFRSASRGYVWFDGYAEPGMQPWMTFSECQAEARCDGVKAVIHKQQKEG